ncbi:DUF4169 family protein [Frigidibacter albus]|uniref:DUF4169 family protein n=1 Tax=Frigidibacter albus TaxID=1465486 RepID=A0A6L8VEJ7_9RHOB|nr:DUF4169 family protein [Frigidibacter albus]MZQ88002.1 DUF4169 family protein [Frigidibacter albus]NBE30324.1 DUF4169 family protein [Frigidibacter albus]GGH48138.1 amidase [Frigidibacter albus]
MTEIINLRQARKQRARAEERSEATARAAKFGRSKAEKALEDAQAGKARAALDGHKIEGQGREPEGGEV